MKTNNVSNDKHFILFQSIYFQLIHDFTHYLKKKNRKSLSPSLKQVKNQGLFSECQKKVNDNIKSVCDITLQANEHNESLINIYLQGARQDNRDTQDNSCIIKQTYFMLVLIVNRMLVRATTPNS